MINFNQFTLNNQGVTDLGKVLFTTAFAESNLFDTCTKQTGVKNGEKLDFVDNMGEVGKAGRGCNPTYESVSIEGIEKVWALGDWNFAKKICYKELENTIAKWAFNEGTEKENLTTTEFWNKIYLPLVNKAFTSFFWRAAWFSDSAAQNITDGGVITDGVDTDLIKITDGLWKRLFALGASQRTTIAANSEATYAAQKSAIKTAGVALSIFDDILSNADSRIAANGGIIMVTNSLYQAFRRDYAQAYKDTIPFMEVAEGVKLPTYDGIPVKPIMEWDTLIAKYENSTTALNAPHRAVFSSIENLFVGTGAKDVFAEFDTVFDQITRYNYNYAASNIGTLIKEDALVQVAY